MSSEELTIISDVRYITVWLYHGIATMYGYIRLFNVNFALLVCAVMLEQFA